MIINMQTNNKWHTLSGDLVLKNFNTSPDGLSSNEAISRLKEAGHNKIYRQKRENAFKILVRQLSNPLIYILLSATILAIMMDKITDGIVVFFVVVINTIIGFIQEYEAGKAIQGLLKLVPEHTTLMRNGEQTSIAASDLVPGDYVLLQAGDRVPADIRLIFEKNVECDESILTGESFPVMKGTGIVDEDADIADRSCMLFSGTLITSGTADGVVVATGMETEIGKISSLLESTEPVKSTLSKSLEKIAKGITYSIVIVSIAVFAIAILRDYTFIDAAFSAITLAVATIPEGLPAVITIASAIGITRMARRKAIIRHLSSVETLGSTTVICSDKTGTLTRNEMTVSYMWNGKEEFEVTGTGINLSGSILKINSEIDAKEDEIGELFHAATLCNDATIQFEDENNIKAVGDPTEIALIVASGKFGIEQEKMMEKFPRLDELPFDPVKKKMATLHTTPSGDKIIYLKGAPESVIPILTKSEKTTDQINPEQIQKKAFQLAENGVRVLAFASKKSEKDNATHINEDLRQFNFLGLMGISDPPRLEVKDAIEVCHKAGISVKMITGDHPATAAAIGKKLGLIEADRVIIGKDLKVMNESDLKNVVKNTQIFARVSPQEKLRLISVLQSNGEIVAMTGDGVNDAPALKRADIGIAMGISGTAVAKESADMILANDNFESIEAAIEEGRRVFDNLLKCLIFLLPTSIGLGLVIFVAVLFFPIERGTLLRPMLPVQALWINLITAVALTLPLALEAKEPDVMNRPPRKPGAPLFNSFFILRIIIVALIMAGGTVGLFLSEYHTELSRGTIHSRAVSEAQTMAVTAMVLFQVFYLINCRSLKFSIFKIGLFSNPFIYLGISVVLILQMCFVYFPFMNHWFNSSPLKAEAWLMSILMAFPLLIIVGIEKMIRQKYFT